MIFTGKKVVRKLDKLKNDVLVRLTDADDEWLLPIVSSKVHALSLEVVSSRRKALLVDQFIEEYFHKSASILNYKHKDFMETSAMLYNAPSVLDDVYAAYFQISRIDDQKTSCKAKTLSLKK